MDAPRVPRGAGLTLIELLVAVVILATSAVFVMGALARAAEAQAIADEQRCAYLFGLEKMAALEVGFFSGQEIAEKEEGSFLVGAQRFAWRTVARHPDEARPEVTAVALTVAWRRGEQDYAQQYRTTFTRPKALDGSPPPKP